MSSHVWHIEGSLPPETDRHWRHNVSVTVIAETLPQAVGATMGRFPGIEVHKAMRDRDAHEFIDARPIKETNGQD